MTPVTKFDVVFRIFWVVSFIIACGFAANFIMNVYEKWTNSPVIMSLAPDSTNLSSIPFPAITICNMNNVRKSVAMSILERYDSHRLKIHTYRVKNRFK